MTQEMTEEKAIERIKLALEWDDIYGHCYILQEDIDRQAFHMAIKALEEKQRYKKARAKAMELKDTIDGMLSGYYVERFKAEYKQLTIRLNKLNDVIDNAKNYNISFTLGNRVELLEAQSKIMQEYKDILEKRATNEGINLD